MCSHGSVLVFLLQQWYTSTMNLIGTWLTDRMDLQLHVYQLKILIRIVKVRTFILKSQTYLSCSCVSI